MNSYEDIKKFIFSQDSNLLNRPHSPRAFDQKIKWDVINIVAKCILKFLETKKNFSRKELQTAEYSNKLVTEIFKKPKTTDPMSANEYDKFFDQPLNYLSFYSILEPPEPN